MSTVGVYRKEQSGYKWVLDMFSSFFFFRFDVIRGIFLMYYIFSLILLCELLLGNPLYWVI